MASISFPKRYLTEEDLNWFINSESITTAIPYAFTEAANHYIQAFIYISDGELISVTFDPSQRTWREEVRHSLSNTVYTEWKHSWLGDVFFVGKDATVARKIHDQISRTLDQTYSFMAPVMPRSDSPPQLRVKPSCICQSETQQKYLGITEPSANLAQQHILCSDCNRFRGLRIDEEPLRADTVFSEDWLFENQPERMVEQIINTSQDDRYCLFSNGSSITRVERVIDALSFMVKYEAPFTATYNPIDHKSLVCIEDGTVAGFVDWEKQHGLTIMDQLYVREGFRRQGIAQTLAETWREHCFTGGNYYLDDPNRESKALYEKIGDLDADTPPRANEGYGLAPTQIHIGPSFWSHMQNHYNFTQQ